MLALAAGLWHFAKTLYRAARRIEQIDVRSRELEQNGGKSIRDRVASIQSTVEHMAERVDAHEQRITRQEGRVEALASVVTVASPAIPVTTPVIVHQQGGKHESGAASR